jgi:hypothetical protein
VRSRLVVSLLVITGALAAAPWASAATLSVDDDGQDCPAAPFSSIQDAIDAAESGDTVAICPGRYAEGTGSTASNGLTIVRNVTLKGAGADLVTISPRRSTPTGGQIIEAEPDIRNGVGDIVSVVGGSAFPITVNISGVTIDGNGVYVEAGVVYLDAQGTISRSRITNVVTSEAADAYQTTPGGWRGPQPGYGVAQVTAATAAPAGATARTLVLDNNRIDRYNRAGVLIAGLADGANTLVDNRGVLNASEVVGRIFCQNYADGRCGSPFGNPPNSPPAPATTGPLFGQDGVLVTDRARATVQNSSISSNVTQGEGAPVRQAYSSNGTETNPGTAGNENLWRAAGIRLVGADAANSLITKNNIVANGYGVYNAQADGTTASTVPVDAPDNWWGLRGTPPPTNNGPAISPTYNPPIPENPVNGAPVDTGSGITSSAVDFLPYRSGPQSDPTTGQFSNIQAPMPVSDAAPTVLLEVNDTTADRGQVLLLTATGGDDFGIKRITFYDGSTVLGSVNTPPYTQAFTVPADAPCADRTLTAVVEDSSGQTNSASKVISVVGPNNCQPPADPGPGGGETPPTTPTPTPVPPGGSLPNNVHTIDQSGTVVAISPTSNVGIAKIEWFLGDRLICTVTGAPFTCTIVPKASDVGLQSLRVVITDKNGLTTVLSRQVLVPLFKARGVSISVKYQRASRGRVRRTITARVLMPNGVSAREACASSRINLVVTRNFRPFSNSQPSLDSVCSARLRITSRRGKRQIYAISARFGGNTVLLPVTKSRRFS